MKYLGKAVDVAKFHSINIDTLTLGQVLGDGGVHDYSEVLLPDSFFESEPDFANGRFDQQMGGVLCHYVRSNATLSPNHVGTIDASYSLSASAVSSSSKSSLKAGFSASVGCVSASASLS